MKCWSRSTLGVLVGVLNVVGFVLALIAIVIQLVHINTHLQPEINSNFDTEHAKTAIRVANIILSIILVICIAMVIISGLLIMGIVKRRHLLMAPWLVISAICMVCSTARFIYGVFVALTTGVPLPYITFSLICGSLLIVLQFYFLYKIYELYKDIRAKCHERPHQMLEGRQTGFHNNPPVQENRPDKYYGASEKF